jgi:3-deoxy-D-manno-octulosonic-acid transferase
MVLDTIGHLSNAYFYADLAFVGGGFGRGLHNILEALAFGVPVVYGPEVDRYPEALESMASEVAYKISDVEGLGAAINRLLPSSHLENPVRAKCLDFINWHSGATEKVIKELLN